MSENNQSKVKARKVAKTLVIIQALIMSLGGIAMIALGSLLWAGIFEQMYTVLGSLVMIYSLIFIIVGAVIMAYGWFFFMFWIAVPKDNEKHMMLFILSLILLAPLGTIAGIVGLCNNY